MSQKKWITIIVGVSLFMAIIGFVAGQFIISPSELASRSQAPDASLISVPVEFRQISSNLNLSGDLTFSQEQEISAPTQASSSSDPQIVLSVAAQDQVIDEGDVVADVSSRPVIVLLGELKSYRTMAFGSKGFDVAQLDAALSRLGLLSGKPNDVFDAATGAAVVSLYKKVGYEVTGPTSEEQTQLRDAQKEVSAAQLGYSSAVADISTSKVNEAKNEVASAQSSYDEAVAKANTDNTQAAQDLASAQSVVTQTTADKNYKQGLLTTAQGGINPYNNLAPSTPDESAELGQIVSTLTLEVNDLTAKLAQANGDVVVKQSNITSTSIAGTSAVSRARIELTNAQSKLKDVQAKAANSSKDPDVKSAIDRLDNANKALAELSAKTGVKIQSGEIVFLSSVPARVNSVTATRGQSAEGTLLTVSSSTIAIQTSVAKADKKYVSVGQKAKITIEESSKIVDGTVLSIADSTGTDGAGENRYAVTIEPQLKDKQDTGSAVKIAIPVKTTDGKVLAVPLAAVSVDGDGRPRVQVVDDVKKRKTHFVSVETGLRAQGYVEIKDNSKINKNDKVVVGSRSAKSSKS